MLVKNDYNNTRPTMVMIMISMILMVNDDDTLHDDDDDQSAVDLFSLFDFSHQES